MSKQFPAQIRAIEISTPGAPDVLREARRPLPVYGAGEVLIAVAAAGINRPDVMQRQGLYPPPPGAPDIPGLEVAGEIVACGPSVTAYHPGDRVCALVPGGGYADFCVAAEGCCLPIPAGMTMVQAAALPETYFTVWSNVFERARLATGETLFVQGGSSGIGTTAIQLAAALGNPVFATAGNDEKCRACEQLGASAAINYRAEDFVARGRELTQGRGPDVILDMVAGDYVGRELKLLADDGRLAIIALLGGSRGTIDFSEVLRRRLTITGSTLRPRPVAFKAAIGAALRARVWPLLEAGKARPMIHATYPLTEAAAAHALMESSQHVGKIVLVV